ncbi:MAG: alpha/beta hydrolase [Gammaproteobacteria bacterium]|nr:alpha/beta hydrolase [Gammaproteobacteria bacterium]MCP5425699.1 alpha/beta hydrolase [Gammaproteobacteria bacterium]MCP5459730.1 alpha/beta hydrolase [Gammaproteobacteria bacterium]
MAMTRHYLWGLGPHGFHRIHYTAWGDPDNPRVLICVHGLTRNARDFDFFAAALANDYRILCVDAPGRGHSDWFTHKEDYSYPVYAADMAAVIARSGAEQVDWVGTSMGGLIGMSLAMQPHSPIRKLVMNDVGPFIPKEALERIAAYVGKPLRFADLDELERYLRIIAAPFGPASDEQWRHMALHSSRQTENGSYQFSYDPGIAEVFHTALEDVDLWAMWDAIRCPTLVLRGADSDVLTRADAKAMTQRGPRAQLVEFAGVGHAPGLMTDDQIATVRDWLLAD